MENAARAPRPPSPLRSQAIQNGRPQIIFQKGAGFARRWAAGSAVVGWCTAHQASASAGGRAPPWVLHIEHIVALATLNRCQLLLKGGLQNGGARGALELEGRLGGHDRFVVGAGGGLLGVNACLSRRTAER